MTAEPNAETPPTPAPRNRRRLWLRRGFALCFGLLLGLISAEIALRIYVAARGWTPNCYAATLQLLQPHPENGYELSPGFRLQSGSLRIQVNQQGLRGPEVAAAPIPGTPRIAVLGGSSVFGYLVNDGEEAAHRLQAELQAAGIPAETLNAGVPGYNLFQTTVRFQERVAPLRPDVVLLYLGWNDLPYVVNDDPDADRFRRLAVAPAWERLLSHSVLYGFVAYRLLDRTPEFVLPVSENRTPTDPGLKQFRDNLRRLAAAVDRSGARLVVCSQVMAAHPRLETADASLLAKDPAHREAMIALGDRITGELRDFAADRGAPFIDARAAIPPSQEVLGDAIHLTAAGEQRLVALWAERLAPLLQESPAPPAAP